jgi:hypothetical protein
LETLVCYESHSVGRYSRGWRRRKSVKEEKKKFFVIYIFVLFVIVPEAFFSAWNNGSFSRHHAELGSFNRHRSSIVRNL